MGRTLTYPKLPFNTVNRHKDQGIYPLLYQPTYIPTPIPPSN